MSNHSYESARETINRVYNNIIDTYEDTIGTSQEPDLDEISQRLDALIQISKHFNEDNFKEDK